MELLVLFSLLIGFTLATEPIDVFIRDNLTLPMFGKDLDPNSVCPTYSNSLSPESKRRLVECDFKNLLDLLTVIKIIQKHFFYFKEKLANEHLNFMVVCKVITNIYGCVDDNQIDLAPLKRFLLAIVKLKKYQSNWNPYAIYHINTVFAIFKFYREFGFNSKPESTQLKFESSDVALIKDRFFIAKNSPELQPKRNSSPYYLFLEKVLLLKYNYYTNINAGAVLRDEEKDFFTTPRQKVIESVDLLKLKGNEKELFKKALYRLPLLTEKFKLKHLPDNVYLILPSQNFHIPIIFLTLS
jgi:hypothetical protein